MIEINWFNINRLVLSLTLLQASTKFLSAQFERFVRTLRAETSTVHRAKKGTLSCAKIDFLEDRCVIVNFNIELFITKPFLYQRYYIVKVPEHSKLLH